MGTEKAFNVARTIYDRFGLPDGDYYTAYEGFSNFVEMWSLGGSGTPESEQLTTPPREHFEMEFEAVSKVAGCPEGLSVGCANKDEGFDGSYP